MHMMDSVLEKNQYCRCYNVLNCTHVQKHSLKKIGKPSSFNFLTLQLTFAQQQDSPNCFPYVLYNSPLEKVEFRQYFPF